MKNDCCKICGNPSLIVFAHTARCDRCNTLLYFPYPNEDELIEVSEGERKSLSREFSLEWYTESAFNNHINFTNMIRFAMDESFKGKKLDILDYGGGAGQFSLVLKSHFPECTTYITDICDAYLLEEFGALNRQIRFSEFDRDETKFDFIFLNDVFEHLVDPLAVLKQLEGKLKIHGKIFIDTPRQFWIYPILRQFSTSLYKKVLRGTVSTAHLQIWSKQSFEFVVKKCGLKIVKYKELCEFTMPANFYMNNMGITNPITRFAGNILYRCARWLVTNKIQSVITK